MGVDPERVAAEPVPAVGDRDHRPDPGVVPRQDHPEPAPRPPGRRAHQPRHVPVAAHDPVEGDEVRVVELGRERHRVALAIRDPVAEPAPLRLATGHGQVRAGGVDVDGGPRARLEQRVVDRAHAGADVEHRHPVDAAVRQLVDQAGRPVVRSVALVLAQLELGRPGIEAIVVDVRITAVHASMLGPERGGSTGACRLGDSHAVQWAVHAASRVAQNGGSTATPGGDRRPER